MTIEAPRHSARELPTGEIVYFVRPPDHGWLISEIEFGHRGHAFFGYFEHGRIQFPFLQGRQFQTIDAALKFVWHGVLRRTAPLELPAA